MKRNNRDLVTRARQIIVENFHIKIICFVLALVMYFTINYFQQSEKTFSCNLQVTGLRHYLVLSNDVPEQVKVTVRDKPAVLDQITETDFNLRLDLSNVDRPIESRVKLEWDVPNAMRTFFSTVKVEEQKVDIIVQKVAEKSVPVRINKIGDVAFGYMVKRTTIDPPLVRISGPEGIVEETTFIETETIDIEGEIESFRRFVNLYTPSPMIRIIGASKCEVYFEIIKETDVSSFKINKIDIVNLKKPFEATFETRTVTVRVSGPKSELIQLNNSDIALSVDCSPVFLPGPYSYKIQVALPPGFELVSVSPEVLDIEVKDSNK
jgi:YbbR domain-containing protein